MSRKLIPMFFSNWWEHLESPHRLLNQDFGSGLQAHQLLVPRIHSYVPSLEEELRQRNALLFDHYKQLDEYLSNNYNNSSSTITADKDKFQVILDVQQFKPDEINVKVVEKDVVVEAKHEEKRDEHGWISRQFVRKYKVPGECDIDQLHSTLSSDGVLTITAPKIKDSTMLENEKKIPIEHTGKPAIHQSSIGAAAAAAINQSKIDKKDDEKMESLEK